MKLIKLTETHYIVVDENGKQLGWKFDNAYIKKLIGEVDVEKKAAELAYLRRIKFQSEFEDGVCSGLEEGYSFGYHQALEDNKGKKYTEEDLRKAMQMYKGEFTKGIVYSQEQIIQSLQSKTEWEVEIIDGKLKLK